MAGEQKKINTGKWFIKIGVALFFDVIKWLLLFIPVAGEILGDMFDIVFYATFWLWFKMEGGSYSGGTLLIGAIVGAIPVIGEIIPDWTLSILKLYFDAKSQKVIAKVPGGQMAEKAMSQKNQTSAPSKSGGQATTPATQKNNVTPINSGKNFSPAEYDKFNKDQREKMGLTAAMPGSKSSGGGYDKWNKEQHEKIGLTQATPGARSGNKAGDPFHSGGINGDYYVSGGGEKVLMPTRTTKTPKSYEQVLEDEKKHYEEWNSKKAA